MTKLLEIKPEDFQLSFTKNVINTTTKETKPVVVESYTFKVFFENYKSFFTKVKVWNNEFITQEHHASHYTQ